MTGLPKMKPHATNTAGPCGPTALRQEPVLFLFKSIQIKCAQSLDDVLNLPRNL